MNITKKWKKALVVGCSHGVHADPAAIEAVLAFRESYEPHTVVHLGDFVDTTASGVELLALLTRGVQSTQI